MDLQVIKTEKEYQSLLAWIDRQFDTDVSPESEAGQKLQMALLSVKQYEDLH
jgi:HTH-type transcriptional regulator/antitoxin HigA